MNAIENIIQPIAPTKSAKISSPNGKPSAGENQVNILLVDDREDKLQAMEAVLSELNQNLIKARSGKEALRHLLHTDFAVILLDVTMPGMDGFETATFIRQRLKSEHTPIIFVTSHSDSENHIAKGYSLGAVDYMMTPIVSEVLKTKVSVFVELYKKTEQIKQQAERLRCLGEIEHQKQLTAAQDRLEEETQRNRFFTLSIELLAIANFEGQFLQLNPTWQETLGFTEEELKAKPFLEFIHAEDRPATAQQLQQLKTGVTTYFENRCCGRDGSVRWLRWTATPFIEEELLYLFARDITTRKVAEDEIRNLNNELERRVHELIDINKELEAFSYSISHDLRAPLRSMQGFAHSLLREYGDKLDDDGKEFAHRIVNSSMYMDTLLHDLLDYSRLSRMELQRTSVHLETVINEILGQIGKDVQDKNAEINVQRPLAAVSAHLPTVRQILSNLISNALKFIDPSRKPEIQIRTEPGEKSIRIWVEDNGIGIAPEHHHRIFGLFERLHSNKTYAGTGIGLALVRKGAERMGGAVGVESETGRGSRFWLELGPG
ncbi:MAG: hybrid sensor histidine kinase/response regulator [Limisphaerales bacterium]